MEDPEIPSQVRQERLWVKGAPRLHPCISTELRGREPCSG